MSFGCTLFDEQSSVMTTRHEAIFQRIVEAGQWTVDSVLWDLLFPTADALNAPLLGTIVPGHEFPNPTPFALALITNQFRFAAKIARDWRFDRSRKNPHWMDETPVITVIRLSSALRAHSKFDILDDILQLVFLVLDPTDQPVPYILKYQCAFAVPLLRSVDGERFKHYDFLYPLLRDPSMIKSPGVLRFMIECAKIDGFVPADEFRCVQKVLSDIPKYRAPDPLDPWAFAGENYFVEHYANLAIELGREYWGRRAFQRHILGWRKCCIVLRVSQ